MLERQIVKSKSVTIELELLCEREGHLDYILVKIAEMIKQEFPGNVVSVSQSKEQYGG